MKKQLVLTEKSMTYQQIYWCANDLRVLLNSYIYIKTLTAYMLWKTSLTMKNVCEINQVDVYLTTSNKLQWKGYHFQADSIICVMV